MLKAQILLGEPTEPIQVQMSADEALALAYIANDFVRSVSQDSSEVQKMAGFASLLSAKLQDCLVARTAMPSRPMRVAPVQMAEADAA